MALLEHGKLPNHLGVQSPEPIEVEQVIEAGDIVVVRGLYLSPQIIVMNACHVTKQVQGSWFDKEWRMQIGSFPAEDLIIQSKRSTPDVRLSK